MNEIQSIIDKTDWTGIISMTWIIFVGAALIYAISTSADMFSLVSAVLVSPTVLILRHYVDTKSAEKANTPK